MWKVSAGVNNSTLTFLNGRNPKNYWNSCMFVTCTLSQNYIGLTKMWVPAHTQTSHPDQYFPLHAKTQWKVRIPLTLGRHHKADHQNTQKSVTFPKQSYYYKINEIVFRNTSYELEWSLQRALCSQSPLRRLLQQLPSLPSLWTRLAVVQLWLCCLLLFQPLPWMSHCFTSSAGSLSSLTLWTWAG